MVFKKPKSRTLRRVSKRTPGGKVTMHYVARKPSRPTCGGCGLNLHGTPCLTKAQAKATSKSSKRPERPHGGVLCSKCSRQTVLNNIRASQEAPVGEAQ